MLEVHSEFSAACSVVIPSIPSLATTTKLVVQMSHMVALRWWDVSYDADTEADILFSLRHFTYGNCSVKSERYNKRIEVVTRSLGSIGYT
jgi:hypothetical protein